MHFRLRTLTLASIAIAALGLASVVTPVQPAETAKKPSGHCVTDLSKPDTPPTCYDTFTAAIAAATGGQITDAPADSRVAMNDQRLLARMNARDGKKSTAAIPQGANVLIAVFFFDDGFGGPSLSYRAPHGCTDTLYDIDHSRPHLDGQLDNFISFRAFNNCRVRLWQHRDFQGAMLDWASSGNLPDDWDSVGSLQFS